MGDLNVERLSDEFGQYLIQISCPCGHRRDAYPATFAAIAGWDAKLADVMKRLRCSKCNGKRCAARAIPLVKPRGLRDGR